MWHYISNAAVIRAGYHLWKHTEGYWQMTKENKAPSLNSGGYWDINALMKLKGI